MRLARVVRVNQAQRTLDLKCLDNNEPIQGAQLVGKASSVSGSWDVPNMPMPTSEATAGQIPQTGRAMVAVVEQIGRRAVVLGFLPPQDNPVAFTDQDRAVDLHVSGLVLSKDAAGNLQFQHPGGVTVRVGTPTVENLADVSATGQFTLPTQAEPTITVITAQYTLTIDPTGNLAFETTGNVTVNAGGQATIAAPVVNLGVASGGKRVVVDGDPVSGNAVHASANTHVFAL